MQANTCTCRKNIESRFYSGKKKYLRVTGFRVSRNSLDDRRSTSRAFHEGRSSLRADNTLPAHNDDGDRRKRGWIASDFYESHFISLLCVRRWADATAACVRHAGLVIGLKEIAAFRLTFCPFSAALLACSVKERNENGETCVSRHLVVNAPCWCRDTNATSSMEAFSSFEGN